MIDQARHQLSRLTSGASARFLGQAGIYGFGRALSQMTSMILLPVYLSYLTPSDYGVLAVSQMAAPVLTALWTWGLETPIGRFYYEYPEDQRDTIVGTAFTLARITTVSGLVLTLAIGPWLFPRIVVSAPYSPHILLVIWTAFFSSFSILPLALMRIREEAHKYIIATFFAFLATSGANIYFVVVREWGVVGILSGNLVGAILSAIGYLWYLRGYMALSLDMDYAERSIRYALPMAPELALGSIVQVVDRFLLDKWVPLSAIGLYSLATKFAGVAHMLIQSVKRAYTPVAFKIWALENVRDRERKLADITLWFVAIGSLTAAGIILFTQELMPLLARTQTQYLDAVPMVPLAVSTSLVLIMYYVFVMPFMVLDKTKPLFIVFLAYAISVVGLNLLLIKWIGVWGALLGSLLSMSVRALITYLLGENRVPIGLPLRETAFIVLPVFLMAPLGVWDWGGIHGLTRFVGKLILICSYGLLTTVIAAGNLKRIALQEIRF